MLEHKTIAREVRVMRALGMSPRVDLAINDMATME
jgi:hypothetical protein